MKERLDEWRAQAVLMGVAALLAWCRRIFQDRGAWVTCITPYIISLPVIDAAHDTRAHIQFEDPGGVAAHLVRQIPGSSKMPFVGETWVNLSRTNGDLAALVDLYVAYQYLMHVTPEDLHDLERKG